LLADEDRVQRVRLAGLSGSEVNQLADSLEIGPLTLAAGERLRGHTGGHPPYVKALLGELPPDRLKFGDGELPAPRSFSATVLARLTEIGSMRRTWWPSERSLLGERPRPSKPRRGRRLGSGR
jgi:hypothetical protein